MIRRSGFLVWVLSLLMLLSGCGFGTDDQVGSPTPPPLPPTAVPSSDRDVSPPPESTVVSSSRFPDSVTLTPGLTVQEHFGLEPVGANAWLLSGYETEVRVSFALWPLFRCSDPALDTTDLVAFHTERDSVGVTGDLVAKYGFGFSGRTPTMLAHVTERIDPWEIDSVKAVENCPKMGEQVPFDTVSSTNNFLAAVLDATENTAGIFAKVHQRFWVSDAAAPSRAELEACLAAVPGYDRLLDSAPRLPHPLSVTPPSLPQGLWHGLPTLLAGYVALYGNETAALADQEIDRKQMLEVLGMLLPPDFGSLDAGSYEEAYEIAERADRWWATTYWECYEPLHAGFVAAERDWTAGAVTQEELDGMLQFLVDHQELVDYTPTLLSDLP